MSEGEGLGEISGFETIAIGEQFKDPAEIEARVEKPKIEEGDSGTARMPEATREAFPRKGFEVLALGDETIAQTIDAIMATGIDVDWQNIPEDVRERLLSERLPHSEVALKRGTKGHPQIQEIISPELAREKLDKLSVAVRPNNPGTRGIMGDLGLHLGLIAKQLEGWNADTPLENPIYAPAPYFDSTSGRGVRIRTSSVDGEGNPITIEIKHNEEEPGVGVQGIRIVPQVGDPYSARTYMPFVPTQVADRIEPVIPQSTPAELSN